MSELNYDISISEMFKIMNSEYSNKKICEMTEDLQLEYEKLFNDFEMVNSSTESSPKLKGESLESLVTFLISSLDGLFKVKQNVRTRTNELDQLVNLTPSGKRLVSEGIINKNFNSFICECKNYNRSVSVTYVGKFCSLLITNQTQLGILFSYKGVSGKNWDSSSGLIKKFYLSKEKKDERFCIIDFNVGDFKAILEGDNFLDIIDRKIEALQLDTDYKKLLSKHDAEEKFVKEQ